MNNGERCKNGWHLKGTVPEINGNGSEQNINQKGNKNGLRSNVFQNHQNGSLNQGQDILSSMVRREMGIVLREIFQTPNPQPNPQVKKQSGRDYLWAFRHKPPPYIC